MRISQYSQLTQVQADDVLPIVDVHDTSMAGSGTTKKITAGDLLAARRGQSPTPPRRR